MTPCIEISSKDKSIIAHTAVFVKCFFAVCRIKKKMKEVQKSFVSYCKKEEFVLYCKGIILPLLERSVQYYANQNRNLRLRKSGQRR